jgi:hypothetical protein
MNLVMKTKKMEINLKELRVMIASNPKPIKCLKSI